jgi:hypothetical protein
VADKVQDMGEYFIGTTEEQREEIISYKIVKFYENIQIMHIPTVHQFTV